MSIKTDFQDIASKLNSAIVNSNIAIPQITSPSYNQRFVALADNFYSVASQYGVTPQTQEIDLGLPKFRHAIQGLNDTINNDAFNDDAVKYYVQTVSDQLAAHGAVPKL
jgi:hypothetical protein